MSDPLRYALVALVVFMTQFQQGITGFGSTVLALPFVVLLVGLKVGVPVLVIQAWVFALVIIIESRRKIVWGEFGKIAGLVALGLPFGIWMARALPESALKWLLIFFMLVVGVRGLIRGERTGPPPPVSSLKSRVAAALLPLGGIIHGAYGSGGPVIVIYATRALTDKGVFRVTLCLVWLALNTVLIGQWAAFGDLTPDILRLAAVCLPLTLLGLALGNRVHYAIAEGSFRRLVYAVLLAAGVVLAWSLLK